MGGLSEEDRKEGWHGVPAARGLRRMVYKEAGRSGEGACVVRAPWRTAPPGGPWLGPGNRATCRPTSRDLARVRLRPVLPQAGTLNPLVQLSSPSFPFHWFPSFLSITSDWLINGDVLHEINSSKSIILYGGPHMYLVATCQGRVEQGKVRRPQLVMAC